MHNQAKKGIFFKVLNLLIYSFISINLKFVIEQKIHIYQVVFLSAFFGLIISNIIPHRNNKPTYKYTITKMYILRGICSTVGLVCWVKSLSIIPLVEATAISYITPIFASILSLLLLKERITLNLFIAITLGFIGMMVIVRPGADVLYAGSIMAVISAFAWALHDVIVRYNSKTDNYFYQMHLAFLMVVVFSMPLAITHWVSLTLTQWIHITFIGALLTLNKIFLVQALSNTTLIILSPISFLRLIFTSILAYLFFSETIDFYIVIGSLIIIFATSITIRESTKLKFS